VLASLAARGRVSSWPVVGKQDVLAETDPARDSLSDLPGSDDDDDFLIGHIAHH